MEVECQNISSDDDDNSQNFTRPQRSPRIRKVPDQYDEWTYITHRLSDPSTVKEALSSPEKNEWMKAIESENNSLHTNEVWDLAEIPSRKLVVVSGCSNENIMLMDTWKNTKLDW